VWTFTQRNVPLWDILEFFPPDAIGPRGPADAPRPYEVKTVTIDTDLGWSFGSTSVRRVGVPSALTQASGLSSGANAAHAG
jgi:hypothetical protein